MWKSLNAKAQISNDKGLISSEEEINVVVKPEGYTTVMVNGINKLDISCHLTCISNDKNNVVMLEPTIQKYTMGHNLRLMFDSKQVGFIVTMPHTISVKDDGNYFSCLTTYLAVMKKHRSKEVVQYLINQLMINGYPNGVTTGYFFGTKPKTKTAIPIYTWYRPLNVDKCKRDGYTIILPKEFSEMDHETQMMAARMFYGFKSQIKPKPTTYDDLQRAPQRMISLNLSKEDFIRFNRKPFTWNTYSDDNGGIITCTMPYNILQPTGTIVKASILIYCESLLPLPSDEKISSSDYPSEQLKVYLDSMFYNLNKQGYTAIHGTNMGVLNYPPGQFFGPVLGISCGMMFVDFYNLKTTKITNPSDINVMYL